MQEHLLCFAYEPFCVLYMNICCVRTFVEWCVGTVVVCCTGTFVVCCVGCRNSWRGEKNQRKYFHAGNQQTRTFQRGAHAALRSLHPRGLSVYAGEALVQEYERRQVGLEVFGVDKWITFCFT